MHRSRGFSLVEILVSIVVLAVGVLGAAGMQITALRTAKQSGLQSTALQLASEMADRMRANNQQMQLEDLDNPYLGVDYQARRGDPQVPSADCFSQDCDAGELAGFDLHDWLERVRTGLPGGRAVICRDGELWDKAHNRLDWECEDKAAGAAPVVIKIGWQGKDPAGKPTEDLGPASPPGIALVVSPYAP